MKVEDGENKGWDVEMCDAGPLIFQGGTVLRTMKWGRTTYSLPDLFGRLL